MSEFSEFKKWFKYYQDKFELSGYKVYFKYEPVDGGFADICVIEEGKIATVRLNSKKDKSTDKFKDVKRSAKHEALHLLTHKLEYYARCRYIQESEIISGCEELVHQLARLIKD